MSIKIRVFHSVSETDYEDYHAWSTDGEALPFNDEKRVMAYAQSVVDGLRVHGIEAEIAITHYHRQPYPGKYI